METNCRVTAGHSLSSAHRYRKDVRHMVVYEDIYPKPVNPNKRTRLFLDEDAYQTALRMERKGWIKILVDATIENGHIEEKYNNCGGKNE